MISFAGGKCTADQNDFLVLAAVVRVIRNRTKLGRNMFAVGGNTKAAAVSGEQRLPRRYRLYDKIKDRVSLRTVDTVIIVTAVLITGFLVYGIINAKPPQQLHESGKNRTGHLTDPYGFCKIRAC